jgi:hypothetical protein
MPHSGPPPSCRATASSATRQAPRLLHLSSQVKFPQKQLQLQAPHPLQFITRHCKNKPFGHQQALAGLFRLILLTASAFAGLFTPEEYAARQKEVHDQANSLAAAVEEQKEAARREQLLDFQVARISCLLCMSTHTLHF